MPRVLQGLVEAKTLAIFRVLSRNPATLHHLQSISQASKVPLATTFRIVKRLVISKHIDTVKVGKLTLYKAAKSKEMEVLRALL